MGKLKEFNNDIMMIRVIEETSVISYYKNKICHFNCYDLR